MFVGVARIRIHLPESTSLKAKRQVVKSIMARAQNQFSVAIAEIDDQDLWQVATLGLAIVSGEAGHAEDQLDRVIRFFDTGPWPIEVAEVGSDLIQTELEAY